MLQMLNKNPSLRQKDWKLILKKNCLPKFLWGKDSTKYYNKVILAHYNYCNRTYKFHINENFHYKIFSSFKSIISLFQTSLRKNLFTT